MTRPKHPSKDIEKTLKRAEGQGWRIEKASGAAHPWGRLYCPLNLREGCRMSIWSTPKSITNHAKQIERYLMKCEHIGDNNNDDL